MREGKRGSISRWWKGLGIYLCKGLEREHAFHFKVTFLKGDSIKEVGIGFMVSINPWFWVLVGVPPFQK